MVEIKRTNFTTGILTGFEFGGGGVGNTNTTTRGGGGGTERHRRSSSGWNIWQLCLGICLGACGNYLWMVEDVRSDHEIQTSANQLFQATTTKATATAAAAATDEPEGWHAVHVFYGAKEGLFNDVPSTISATQASYAQVGQDTLLLDLLGNEGYFLDLAANDAVDLTNTLMLERHGWTGLCIEPNPRYWYGLAHRNCTVVGALVAGTIMTKVQVKFRGVFGGIVGKLDNKLANRKKEPDAPALTRYTAPITQVLGHFHVPYIIDYVSLDVEGSEYEIMKDFPFDTYTIRVLTVERPNKQLQQLLTEHGYVYLAKIATWGEYLWCHKSTGLTPDHPKIAKITPRT